MNDAVKTYRDILLITIANILAHSYLFFLTGIFWDDWGYIDHNTQTLWQQFTAAGIPSRAIIIQLVWNIPHYGFRWVVFASFLIMAILFYLILRKITIFDNKSSVIIPVLFTAIPLNDCRVILCDVPYTIGLLSFFLGFFLLTVWFENRYWILRILVHICFLLSFTINSLLFFYAIVLLYIYIKESVSPKQIFKSFVKMIHYSDFLIAPIAFFVTKQLLFPTYGPYENYNQIQIKQLVHSLMILPLGVCKQLSLIGKEFLSWLPFQWVSQLALLLFLGGCGVRLIFTIRHLGKNKHAEINVNPKKIFILNSIYGLLLGIFLIGIGMFPYIVIRGGYILQTDGVGSRDSMLLPIGVAITIYFLIILLIGNNRFSTFLFITIFVCGAISFNFHYLDYQRDFYWQESLTEKFRDHQELADKSNLLFLSDDDNGCECTRFYSLNANAAMAYQNEKRLIMCGYRDLYLPQSEYINTYLRQGYEYLMKDYDISNKKLDGVIVYSNKISHKKAVQLKLLELFDYIRYKEMIRDMGNFDYYGTESDEAKILLQGYEY